MSTNPPTNSTGTTGSGTSGVPFPILVLAMIIVGSGIFYVAQYDAKAGWLLALLILLAIGFAYPSFGSELGKLFGNASPLPAANLGASVSTNGAVTVGPNGPIGS